MLLALAALPGPALAADPATGPGEQNIMGESNAKVALEGTVGAGNCSTQVRVIDEGGRPMGGVRVALQTPQNYAATGSDGCALLTDLVHGVAYKVIVSKSGYITTTVSYTCWLRDHTEPDKITVQLLREPKPTPEPTATPMPEPTKKPGRGQGGQEAGYEINEAGELVIHVEPGESRVLVPQEIAEKSAELNAPIRVQYQGLDGEPVSALIEAFTEHDAELLWGNELWLEQLEQETYLHIVVPWQEGARERDALVPHNLQTTACSEALPLRGSFHTKEDPEGQSYQYSNVFTPETLAKGQAYEQFELGLRYSDETAQGAVLAVNNALHGDTGIPVPAALFQMAGGSEADLIVQHHDPDNETDLLYGWKFAGSELAQAALDGLPATLDLFASNTPKKDDPILERTRGMDPQYLTVRYDGALPVTAALRIKDLKGFDGQAVDLLYSDPEADGLQTVVSAVEPDKDGYYVVELEHCSSYALVAASTAAAGGVAAWQWLVLTLLLALIAADVWLIWRYKKKRRE